MEKKDLLQKTQDLIREATPVSHDLLLLCGFDQIQRHVLNYYRDDLDFPQHSARAIVLLISGMLSYMESWELTHLHPSIIALADLRELLNIWSTQLRG